MKKLKEIIEKEYWKNNQRLYITNVYEKLHDYADICLCNKYGEIIKLLFYVSNLKGGDDIDLITFYFKESRKIKVNEVVELSNKPLYIDKQFTLKKFEKLTKDDILNCTEYFLRKILDCWLIFNIELVKEK
jgi:hypothetical protein